MRNFGLGADAERIRFLIGDSAQWYPRSSVDRVEFSNSGPVAAASSPAPALPGGPSCAGGECLRADPAGRASQDRRLFRMSRLVPKLLDYCGGTRFGFGIRASTVSISLLRHTASFVVDSCGDSSGAEGGESGLGKWKSRQSQMLIQNVPVRGDDSNTARGANVNSFRDDEYPFSGQSGLQAAIP